MTLGEIAGVVRGTVEPSAADVMVAGDAFVDSRSPVAGGLFVALPGEHVDGHAYAKEAVDGGAAAVLVARPVPAPAVVVGDVLDALGSLARHVMRQVTGTTVIGVTGSQGKTSTKDMLAEVLGSVAPTVAARESQNNEIGVPLTALRVTPGTRYVVSEMGARGMGHIAYLAGIMAPTIGIVLNVGVAHLGEFGSQDGVAAAKGELVESLPADGFAILNADDLRVAAMAARTDAAVLTFGRSQNADLRLARVGLDAHGHATLRLEWRGTSTDVTLTYVGEHQAANAAAAAAAALAAGLDLDVVGRALESARQLSRWRMDVGTDPEGRVVINDAYNANPDSMRAAVKALVDIAARRGRGRTVAVLGEMRELGDTSRLEHETMGRFVAGLGVAHLVVVGEAARPMYEAAAGAPSWEGAAEFAVDSDEGLGLARGALQENDVVLVKASRAAGLEGLAAALLAGEQPTTRTDGGR
ncbi:MAG: UDP-N-acetylmuramoyl-tripeptide--D-alanyl-D-alanine ligase [Nocardioidaceae bacterium]